MPEDDFLSSVEDTIARLNGGYTSDMLQQPYDFSGGSSGSPLLGQTTENMVGRGGTIESPYNYLGYDFGNSTDPQQSAVDNFLQTLGINGGADNTPYTSTMGESDFYTSQATGLPPEQEYLDVGGERYIVDSATGEKIGFKLPSGENKYIANANTASQQKAPGTQTIGALAAMLKKSLPLLMAARQLKGASAPKLPTNMSNRTVAPQQFAQARPNSAGLANGTYVRGLQAAGGSPLAAMMKG